MANAWRIIAVTVASGLFTSGCLIKEERATWYLEPDSGAVTWLALEQDVRSDAKTAADRALEELGYWNDVQAEEHEAARTFRELGGTRIRTQVLRSRTPFAVVTEASFPTIDELGRRVLTLDSDAASGSSVLERDGETFTWTWTVPADWFDGDTPLRVVLVSSQFESASGFTLSSDNRVATLGKLEADPAGAEMRTLTLRWKTASGPSGK